MKRQRFQCNTDEENRGGTGKKKPLGGRIIWPLPSSGAAANGRGWVPTIPVTLEVSWRKATLINLSPRLRRMIASSNAQNNPSTPPHPHLKPSTPLPAPPLALYTYKSTSLHIYVQSSSALSPSLFLLYCCLFSLFLTPHPPSPPPPPPSYALKSLWISSYKQWINPSPPCVNGPLNTTLCL